jgi:serine/threonine protein kinase
MKKGGKFLGKGAVGCVYESEDLINNCRRHENNCTIEHIRRGISGEIVNLEDKAVKFFDNQALYREELNTYTSLLNIPNIDDYVPIIYAHGSIIINNEDIKYKCKYKGDNIQLYYVVMQKIKYTLMSNDVTFIDKEEIKKFWQKIKELHSYEIIHSDIKVDNIFVSETGKLYLGDLGSFEKIEDIPKQGVSSYTLGYTFKIEPTYTQPDFDDFINEFSNNLDLIMKNVTFGGKDEFINSVKLFYKSMYVKDENTYNSLKLIATEFDFLKTDKYAFIITLLYFTTKRGVTSDTKNDIFGLVKEFIQDIKDLAKEYNKKSNFTQMPSFGSNRALLTSQSKIIRQQQQDAAAMFGFLV